MNHYTVTVRVTDPREPHNPQTIERAVIATDPDAAESTGSHAARADGFNVLDVVTLSTRTPDAVDVMARHYVICALWSSTGDDGTPLDESCEPSDVSPETWAQARIDCADFIGQAREIIERLPDTYGSHPDCGNLFPRYAAAGHDFWLTRNGHGVGFWDRGLNDDGDTLSAMCKPYGSIDAYIGDDGFIYFS